MTRPGPIAHLSYKPSKFTMATPSAARVYRPNPTPKVLQTKQTTPSLAQSSVKPQPPGSAIAPSVYRPQPVPKVLQTKKALANQSYARSSPPQKQPAVPVAPRPPAQQITRKVVLQKPAVSSIQPRKAVGRPQYAPRVSSGNHVQQRLRPAADRPPVIQRKINLTPRYTTPGKVRDAYRIFLASFQKEPSYEYFNTSDKVIVWFGTGNDEPEADAVTRHGIHWAPVTEEMVSQKIKSDRIDLRYYNQGRDKLPLTSEIVYRVLLSESSIERLSTPELATVLAHEVGTHVIPHHPKLVKMEARQELSGQEQRYFTVMHETNQRSEHLAIRNLTNDRYESMVRDMVRTLPRQDARAASEHYLNDISRYDEQGEAFSLDAYDWQFNYRVDKPRRDNWQARGWLQSHVPEPQLRWTPAQKTLGTAFTLIAAAAMGAYLKYGRK